MATPEEYLRHPAPNLRIHPGSGLSFPWAEYHPDGMHGSSTSTFGADGVSMGMRLLIYWDDLELALKELLGYSYRDAGTLTPRGTPWLRRKTPWQHPIWNQLYVKRIADVRGIRLTGARRINTLSTIGPLSAGPEMPPNTGSRSDFYLADLTVEFWRPPYYVRSDKSILGPDGNPREWLRYTSKNWEMALNSLSRENSTFQWMQGVKTGENAPYFTGGLNQTICKNRVTRTWYQIPEQALFASVGFAMTPDGLPANLVYTRTPAENPLSRFDKALGSTNTTFTTNTTTTLSGTTNTTITTTRTTQTIATTTPSPSAIAGATGYTYRAGSPIGGCVNAPIGGGAAADVMGNWVDMTAASRLFGCYTGTLRYDGVTFTPQPLQLPPDLMLIPRLGGIEALSQVQYDVTFHFELFEPPPGTQYGTPMRGHNLFPYAGNTLWYPILSQRDINEGTSGPKLTPFHYADFTDLFQIL